MNCNHIPTEVQHCDGKRIIICKHCHKVLLVEDEEVYFQLVYEPSKRTRILCKPYANQTNDTSQPIYSIFELDGYTYTFIGWKYSESEVISSYAHGY